MEETPEITEGRLDLRSMNWERRDIPLKGEWEFQWNDFLDPSVFHNIENYVIVPSQWSDLDELKNLIVPYPGKATYQLRIFLNPLVEDLGLTIPPMDTAYVLYWNGREIARNGDLYSDSEYAVPVYYAPLVVELPALGLEENTITLHMANSIYPRPGFRDSLSIGLKDKLYNQFKFIVWIDRMIFWIVGIFVVSLFILPLSIYTRTFLYFELLTVFLTIYYFTILILALRRKRESALGFIISLFIFMVSYVNDVLYANRIIDSFYTTGLGLFAFFFAQAFLLSKRFANAFNTAEILTEELESKVIERTRALNLEKEKTESLLKNIQKDLGYSKKIQKSIIPKLQDVDGIRVGVLFEPMDEVGGDIYDMFRIRNDKNIYRVMLADATGHGIQAALVTMAIKSEYENLKKFIRAPAELMEVLNISIINTYKTMYFSCFIADIDLDKMEISYSSAGHPEQLILRREKLIFMMKTGPIIGLKPNVEYGAQFNKLERNDSICLFSDGMFEIFNSEEEEFGEDRFYNLLSEYRIGQPQDRIESIQDSLKIFKGSSVFDDDMTLLILDME